VTRATARSWVIRAGIGRGRGRKSAPSYPPGGSAAEALGAVLCLVRLAAGKTLAEVGRAVGRGAGTIHRYEHGSAPRAAFVHLPRVAAVLGTTAADLHRAARALMEVSPCPASAPAPAPSLPPPPPETTRSAPRAG
jgi:transcriptional regulator with XRE-family HTH domain